MSNDITSAHPESRDAKIAGAGITEFSRSVRPTGLLTFFAAVWIVLVLSGMILVIHHSNTAGSAGPSPEEWPRSSHILLDAHLPTLVMFAHPRCPCTRASLGELARLAADCPGRFQAQVWFVKPQGTDDDWTNSGLWREAAAIPNVTAHCDNEGIESRIFHAETSGHTVLYDQGGRLLFQGGITIARAHSGDNPGRSALTSLLNHELFTQVHTPVYGCSLLPPEESHQGCGTNQL